MCFKSEFCGSVFLKDPWDGKGGRSHIFTSLVYRGIAKFCTRSIGGIANKKFCHIFTLPLPTVIKWAPIVYHGKIVLFHGAPVVEYDGFIVELLEFHHG